MSKILLDVKKYIGPDQCQIIMVRGETSLPDSDFRINYFNVTPLILMLVAGLR